MAILKKPAKVATTEALVAGPAFPVSGVIDGVTLTAGDRVLVKDQLTLTENGYYEVVAGVPPTLMATNDTIEIEDVIRVSHGDRNAHTAWALIDATNRIFIRQDVKHYSLKSIDALKHLCQVLPDATATVAGYAKPGDGGGGDFYFQAAADVPPGARVSIVSATSANISGATNVNPIQITTSAAHGFQTGQRVRIVGVGGNTNANGDWTITVLSVTEFDLDGSEGNAAYTTGGTASSAKVTTAAAHGFVAGGRLSLFQVLGFSAINSEHDGLGVIDSTNLSFPVPAMTTGTSTPNTGSVGDGGLTFPSLMIEGRWVRLVDGYMNVKWFGAVPDWYTAPSPPGPTDNINSFNAALASMASHGNKTNKLYADGAFYLSGGLAIEHTIVLEGTGQGGQDTTGGAHSAPGTMLVFPKNVTGVRIRSAAAFDDPTNDAAFTVLRDLTIYCKERDRIGHGIHFSAPIRVSNVTVQNFAQDGIRVALGSGGVDGITDGTVLDNCNVSACGGDGFHFEGFDAGQSVIAACSANANLGHGFYDATRQNVYIGCESQNHLQSEYKTEGDINTSCFIGCYAEDNPALSDFKGQVSIIGGAIGQNHITPASSVFILENGVAARKPFVFENKRGQKSIRAAVGAFNPSNPPTDELMIAFEWATLDNVGASDNTTRLRFHQSPAEGMSSPRDGWWVLENEVSDNHDMIRFPTKFAQSRQLAPWFVSGIFLGREDQNAMLSFTAAPTRAEAQFSGEPLTCERGDVVWKSDPLPGGSLGQVCIQSGTAGSNTQLVGFQVKDNVAEGATSLNINNVVLPFGGLFSPGQWIMIDDSAYKITGATIDPANSPEGQIEITPPGASKPIFAGTSVKFKLPEFAQFGRVEIIGSSIDPKNPKDPAKNYEARAGERVVVTTPGTILGLPTNPVDGDMVEVFNMSGGSATVDAGAKTIYAAGGSTLTFGDDMKRTFTFISGVVDQWKVS